MITRNIWLYIECSAKGNRVVLDIDEAEERWLPTLRGAQVALRGAGHLDLARMMGRTADAVQEELDARDRKKPTEPLRGGRLGGLMQRVATFYHRTKR